MRLRRLFAMLAICFAASSRVCAQSAAPARDVALAESYAAQAFEAYGNQQYSDAIALYQKAYDAAPSADALYNIARVYDLGLRDRSLAIDFYRRYLSDPGALPERIKRASQRLTELQEAEAAELEATSAPVVTPPLAEAPPIAGATKGLPVATDAGVGWSALQVAALVSSAVGAVSVGVGAGFGLSVLADASAVDSYCEGNRCSSQRGVDLAKSASTKASIATLGISVGTGLLATGATLWLLGPAATPEQDRAANLRLTPVASRSKFGMELSGAW